MNHPAQVFRDLTSSWHVDAASSRVDCLAAELAASVAEAKGSLCLGLLQKEVVSRLHGLVFLLDGYGLTLRQRYRDQGDGVYVFLDRQEARESEFEGAKVVEHYSEFQLPRAA